MTKFLPQTLSTPGALLSLQVEPHEFSYGPQPLIHTGIGTYEKTTRCPRGWPVHRRCFCTGSCRRPGSCNRPRRSAHDRAGAGCQDGKDGQGRQSPQDRCQEKGNAQESRQEEDCTQGRLIARGFRPVPWGLWPVANVDPTAPESPANAGFFVGDPLDSRSPCAALAPPSCGPLPCSPANLLRAAHSVSCWPLPLPVLI